MERRRQLKQYRAQAITEETRALPKCIPQRLAVDQKLHATTRDLLNDDDDDDDDDTHVRA